ncbi:porin family protein [Formosa sp. S-31]|uniref:type IX secretion/gliding motility protein PorT/SprT n=1 Tax=Formosa sp. S-31 TaxID=2790949 RepID=UPI003EB8144B
MKKIFVILFITLTSYSASAQLFNKEKILNNENFDKDRFSWGYFLGFNHYGFKIDYKEELTDANGRDVTDIQIKTKLGFSVGLLGNMRINDYLDLRFEPGLYISNRELIFPEENFQALGISYNETYLHREVKSTYVHFPLLVKFSAKRLNNFKPFVVGGFSTSLNLNSNQDNPNDNSNGQFRMKKSTFYYELGVGIDFYLHYFKFTPSIRGVFALNDELVPDNAVDGASPWTDNIESLKTRGVFINFTFQ